MTMTYRLANEADIETLTKFRWQYAYETYGFDRQEMCTFRAGFRYFVKTGFEDGYRCLMALDDNKVVGTIYWHFNEGMKSYKERIKEREVYIRYLNVLNEDDAIKDELLDRVMQICSQEKVNEVYAFQNKEVQDTFLQKGFIPQKDYLRIQLAD